MRRQVARLATVGLLAAVLPTGFAIADIVNYEVVTSPSLSFGDGGWGGWSCPAGKIVTGGGFEGEDPVAVSAPGLPGVEWPHYTFGPDEYGWVIQDYGNSAGQSLKVYAICAEETVLAVPVAGTMALIGLGVLLALVGIGGIGRIGGGFRVG